MTENLIARLFARKGIKSVDDLSQDEKATFAQYERTLSKKDLSIADIRDFLKSQISVIEAKWRDMGLNTYAKADLLPLHTAYKALLNVMDAPQLEREQLETYLIGLIENE